MTENPREFVGNKDPIWRRSSHSRQRPNLRLDKLVSSSEESRTSQTSRPLGKAEMGAKIHTKASARALAQSGSL